MSEKDLKSNNINNKFEAPIIEISEYPSDKLHICMLNSINNDCYFRQSDHIEVLKISDNLLNIYFKITEKLKLLQNLDFVFIPEEVTWKCFYNIPGDTFHSSIKVSNDKNGDYNNVSHLVKVEIISSEHEYGNHTVFFKLLRNSLIGNPSLERLEHKWTSFTKVERIHNPSKDDFKDNMDYGDDWNVWRNSTDNLTSDINYSIYKNIADSPNLSKEEYLNSLNIHAKNYLCNNSTRKGILEIFHRDSGIHNNHSGKLILCQSECINVCLTELETNSNPINSLIATSILCNLINISECCNKILDNNFKFLLNLAVDRDYQWINVSRNCAEIIKNLLVNNTEKVINTLGSFLISWIESKPKDIKLKLIIFECEKKIDSTNNF